MLQKISHKLTRGLPVIKLIGIFGHPYPESRGAALGHFFGGYRAGQCRRAGDPTRYVLSIQKFKTVSTATQNNVTLYLNELDTGLKDT